MHRILFVVCLFLFCISISAQDQPLRYYAEKHGKYIGVAIKESYIQQGTAAHNDIVKREFNTVVCENAMKSSSITSSKTSYNFSTADAVVNFAIENNMKIRGHTLFWHGQNAAWITTGTRAQVLDNMDYHAKKMLEHYKGKCFQWDVVNEAYADEGATMRNSAYWSIVGPDFIDSAFVYAHRADPDAKLFYNDFNIETINVKSDAVYAMVKKMVDNKIPIHGVGFQSHEPGWAGKQGFTTYEGLKKNVERFAALGLEIAITELDVGSSTQEIVYADYMKVTLEMPAVTTFMIWGVRDQDSWRASTTPLIYNNSWQPKTAYNSILELLKNTAVVSVKPNIGSIQNLKHSGEFIYNRMTNTIFFRDQSSNLPVVLDVFDLRGLRSGTFTLPVNKAVPISSLKMAEGLKIFKVKDRVISGSFVQNL
jgi:endo-1,4-beta-xylanase